MDPGDWLRTHSAPDDLLERALERRQARPALPARASLLIAFAATFLLGIGLGWGSASRPRAPKPAQGLASADAQPQTVPVRLVFHADGARSVGVAASWNGWDPKSQTLLPSGDGTFSAVIELPRGRYEYLFVVNDEQWVLDPTASLVVDDGFGQQNAVLEI